MFRSPAKKIQKPYEVESLVYKTFRDRDKDKDRAKSPLNKTPIKIQQQQVQAQEATQQIDQLYSSMKQSVDFSIEQRRLQLKELKHIKDELKKEIKEGSQIIKSLKTTSVNDKMGSKSKINDQLQEWQYKVEEQLKEMQNTINQQTIQNYQSDNDQFTKKVDQQPQKKQEGLTKQQLMTILEQFQNKFIQKEENTFKLFCTQFIDKCNLDLSMQIKQEMAKQLDEPKKSYRNKIKKTSEQTQQQQQQSSSQSQLLQSNEEQYNQYFASEIQKIMVLLTPCINDLETVKQHIQSLKTEAESQNKNKTMNDQHDIQSQQIESVSLEVQQLKQQLGQLNTVNEQISQLQTQLSSLNKSRDSVQKSDIVGVDFENSIIEIKQQLQQIRDEEPNGQLTSNNFEKQFTDLQTQVRELMKQNELQAEVKDTDSIHKLCKQIQLDQQSFEQRLNELQLQNPQKSEESNFNLESLKESILQELQENINIIQGKLQQELDKQVQKQEEHHNSGVSQIEGTTQKIDMEANDQEDFRSQLKEQETQLNEQMLLIQQQQQQLKLKIQEMEIEFQELSGQFVKIEQLQETSAEFVKIEQFQEIQSQIVKIEQISNMLQVKIGEFSLVDQKQTQIEGNVLSIEEKISNLEANQCNRKYQESTMKVINEKISLLAKEVEQLQFKRKVPQEIIQYEEQVTDIKELYKLTKDEEFPNFVSEIKNVSEIVEKYGENNEDLLQTIMNQLSGYQRVKMDGNSLYTAFAYQYLLNEINSEQFYVFLELIEETNFEIHYQDKFNINVSDQQIYRNEFIAKCKQIQEEELPLQQIMNDPLDSFYGLSVIYIRNLINYFYQKDEEIQKKFQDLEQNTNLLEWGKECGNEELLFELIASQMELLISVYNICENNLSVKQYGAVNSKEINLFLVEKDYWIAIKQKS